MRIFRINVFFLRTLLFRYRYDIFVSFSCASFFPLWILSLFTSPFPLSCRHSLLSSTFPKFPKGISFLSVFTRVEPRGGEHLREISRPGRSSGMVATPRTALEKYGQYHKKKIKEIKYVITTHTRSAFGVLLSINYFHMWFNWLLFYFFQMSHHYIINS